jgi:hypothetical protein
MKKKLLLILLLIPVINAFAQQPTWTFAAGAGSATAENTKAICTDASGNVYVSGSFSNTVDFDFGAGTANLVSNGSNDIFIASYTSTGTYRWAVRAGGTGNDNTAPAGAICTDGTNVYVTGFYNGAATMFGSTSLTPNGGSGNDVFVAKLNAANGNWIWAVSMGGTGNGDNGFGICLDPLGNPYVLGFFNGTMSGACANVSLGGNDLFVTKLNPTNGACVWMSSGGSTGNDGSVGGGIVYDPTTTEIVVASNFSTAVANFGAFSIPFVGGIDMCVLELNSSTGAWLGAVGAGSSTNDDAVACAYDALTSDIMIVGAITGNVTLPGSISLTASLAGSQDAWIGRYSVSSNGFIWAKKANGNASDRANGVAVSGLGTVVIVGQYATNPTTFGSFSLTNTNSGGFDDVFVVGYSANAGAELWATKNTNTGTQPTAANARAIAYVGSNDYWIAGQHVQGTTFGSTTLNSSGFMDFFIAKLNTPTLVPLHWLNVNGKVNSSKQAVINFKVNETDVASYVVEKSTDGRIYTGIDTINSIGNGENNYSFTEAEALSSIAYYRIKQIDVDGRFTYSTILKLTTNIAATISIYPNPVKNIFTLSINKTLLNTNAVITTATGKTVKQLIITQLQSQIDISNLSSGIYLLKLTNGISQKIVKK